MSVTFDFGGVLGLLTACSRVLPVVFLRFPVHRAIYFFQACPTVGEDVPCLPIIQHSLLLRFSVTAQCFLIQRRFAKLLHLMDFPASHQLLSTFVSLLGGFPLFFCLGNG